MSEEVLTHITYVLTPLLALLLSFRVLFVQVFVALICANLLCDCNFFCAAKASPFCVADVLVVVPVFVDVGNFF